MLHELQPVQPHAAVRRHRPACLLQHDLRAVGLLGLAKLVRPRRRLGSSPSEYFTPYGGGSVVVAPPTTSASNPVSYTYQALNQNDFDMSNSGILLFDDLGGNHRALTVDKAGYGYLLTQGQLCGSSSCYPAVSQGSGGQAGGQSGDPGNAFAFGANVNQCQDQQSPNSCDRITSLALYKDGSPEYLYLWPSFETLTALQLSNNTAQTGSGSLSSTTSPYTGVTLGTANQVIPGDQLIVSGQSTQTVVSVNSNSTSLTVSPGFSSSVSTSSWQYKGYFIKPIHDNSPAAGYVQYPGGSVQVTSASGSDALVWGLANVGSGPPGTGALFAYDASSLTLRWCTTSSCTSNTTTFTSSTFAMPTIANGYVYIPTYGISISGTTYSGVAVYSGH